MKDRLLSITADVLLFLERIRDRLVPTIIYLLFVPFFGFAGTHFQGGQGMNWMSYNVRYKRAIIQRTEGKTVFLYTVWDVSPLTYLGIIEEEDLTPLLDHHAHEASWKWRWHGKLVSSAQRERVA